MDNQAEIFKWGVDILVSNGYTIERSPESVLSTPWSTVIRFITNTDHFYLKQTPSALFLSSEPMIMQLLATQFAASAPAIIASNDDLHCFLMQDAGNPLRQTLKVGFKSELLCQAITQYAKVLRSTETSIEMFLRLGIPDWRLAQLPMLYEQITNKTDFLKTEGISEKELQTLQDLGPQFLGHCKLLSNYAIPETLGYHDFNDKNVLYNPKTKKMTFGDWGETAIIHPFFSLYNCLSQAITHHGIKEDDQTYKMLQNVCVENWLGIATKTQLLEAFNLSKKIRPFYCALACYQFMMSLDLHAYRMYYANKPSVIGVQFRELIGCFQKLN